MCCIKAAFGGTDNRNNVQDWSMLSIGLQRFGMDAAPQRAPAETDVELVSL